MDPVRQEASPVGGKVALLAGGLAISATAWYLAAGFPSTLVNLAVALAVVLWPLRFPWPLNRRRLTRVAIWWLAGGLLGAYFFGVFVLLAGLAVAVAVAVESLRTGASNNGEPLPASRPRSGPRAATRPPYRDASQPGTQSGSTDRRSRARHQRPVSPDTDL